MKDQNDNKTIDWCRSNHSVKHGERMILVLKNIINKRSRASMKDVQGWIGVGSSATRILICQLIAEGYLETNSKKPISLKATDKAIQLFWVAL